MQVYPEPKYLGKKELLAGVGLRRSKLMKMRTELNLLVVVGVVMILGIVVIPSALLLPNTAVALVMIPLALIGMGLSILWSVYITKRLLDLDWRGAWIEFKRS